LRAGDRSLRGTAACVNTIFKVTQAPGSRLKEYLLDRARSFGLVLSIGFLRCCSSRARN
jgi:hypothetical protein